jgi:hypothetical protein
MGTTDIAHIVYPYCGRYRVTRVDPGEFFSNTALGTEYRFQGHFPR